MASTCTSWKELHTIRARLLRSARSSTITARQRPSACRLWRRNTCERTRAGAWRLSRKNADRNVLRPVSAFDLVVRTAQARADITVVTDDDGCLFVYRDRLDEHRSEQAFVLVPDFGDHDRALAG